MLVIIDNYDSFTYNLYQAFATFHNSIKVFRNDKISIDEVIGLNPHGIILSPGPGKPEKAGICVSLIQALVRRSELAIPILGVCLGHQAITVALGGHVKQSDEICHGKTDLITHGNTILYQSLPATFKAGRYHSLIAEQETLPSSLMIDAVNQNNLIMGIRHRHLPIYGVQFHPESILTPEGNILMHNFFSVCIRQGEKQ